MRKQIVAAGIGFSILACSPETSSNREQVPTTSTFLLETPSEPVIADLGAAPDTKLGSSSATLPEHTATTAVKSIKDQLGIYGLVLADPTPKTQLRYDEFIARPIDQTAEGEPCASVVWVRSDGRGKITAEPTIVGDLSNVLIKEMRDQDTTISGVTAHAEGELTQIEGVKPDDSQAVLQLVQRLGQAVTNACAHFKKYGPN